MLRGATVPPQGRNGSCPEARRVARHGRGGLSSGRRSRRGAGHGRSAATRGPGKSDQNLVPMRIAGRPSVETPFRGVRRMSRHPRTNGHATILSRAATMDRHGHRVLPRGGRTCSRRSSAATHSAVRPRCRSVGDRERGRGIATHGPRPDGPAPAIRRPHFDGRQRGFPGQYLRRAALAVVEIRVRLSARL